MNTTLKSSLGRRGALDALAPFLAGVFLFLSAPVVRSQCSGQAEWQETTPIDRLRCGRPGFLTNLTYYLREERQSTTWKQVPGQGTAEATERQVVTHVGNLTNRCQTQATDCRVTSTNSWDVLIPFDAVADLLATDGGACARRVPLPGGCDCGGGQQDGGVPVDSCNAPLDCGNPCRAAFNQLLMICCDGPLYFPPTVDRQVVNESLLTDGSSIRDATTIYESGQGSMRERQEAHLSDPYTIGEFMAEVLNEAGQQRWWDGRFFLNSLVPDLGKQCLSASLLRYRIKVKSKLGIKYTARWSLLLRQFSPTPGTNVLTDLTWSAIGNGQTLYSPWFQLPRPELGEISDGEVVDLRIESEGACDSGACEGGDDTPGEGPDLLGSAHFLVSLGAGDADGLAGVIGYHADTPGPGLVAPERLEFAVNRNVVMVVTNRSGAIHLAAPLMLARIEFTNQNAFWIHCSARNSAGIYLTNAPFISHLALRPPERAGGDALQHIRFRDGGVVTNEFVCESSLPPVVAWRLVSGNGLKGERLVRTQFADGIHLESRRIFQPSTGEELFRQDDLIQAGLGGERLLSRVSDPQGLALTTTNAYDAHGRLRLSLRADGSWERREHDPSGFLRRRIRPVQDEPCTAGAEQCRTLEYDYAAIEGAPDRADVRPGEPRTIIESIRGRVVGKTMAAYLTPDVGAVHKVGSVAAGWDSPSAETIQFELDADSREIFSRQPDGTSRRVTRQGREDGRVVTTQRFDASSQLIESVEERFDRLGRPVHRKTFDGPSGRLLAQEVHSDPDEFRRPTRVTYLDGTSVVRVKAGCCNLARSTDRDGVVTTQVHDSLGRVVSTTRLGVTVSNVLDAAGRVRRQLRRGPNGPETLLHGWAYDKAGRIQDETNALGGVTRHFHTGDPAGRRRATTVQPDGGERIQTWSANGRLESVTGSASYPHRFVYSVTNENGQAYSCVTRILLDAAGRDSAEWEQTLLDHGERHAKTVYAGNSGACRQSFHNPKGQLWKEVDPDGVVTLHAYNARGEREYTCIDANRNDVIDWDGPDRISRMVEDIADSHGTVVRRTRTFEWPDDGRAEPILAETVERSVDGLKTWREDGAGVSTTVRTPLGGGAHRLTETAPGGAYRAHVFRDGRLQLSADYGSNGMVLSRLTFAYDALGRCSAVADARNATTRYEYDPADQMVREIGPVPGTAGGRAPVTTTQYDCMGRVTNSVAPDGGSVARRYSQRGELVAQTGAGVYPVAYAYDAPGRLVYMTNWAGFEAGAGVRVTAWIYDPARGWLREKRYADQRGPKFNYTAGGRLLSRRWVRGVTTAYRYDLAGDLVGIEYDDGVTPGVVHERDRRGQPRATSCGADAWRWWRNPAGELSSEAIVGGAMSGWRTTNVFNGRGLREGLTVSRGGEIAAAQAFSWDAAGRLGAAGMGSTVARYSYDANGSAIGQIVYERNGAKVMASRRAYDLLGRLESIFVSVPARVQGGSGGGSVPLAQEFVYDPGNRRTQRILGDGSRWLYEYDRLNQLTGGRRYWSDWTPVAGQQFAYAFDDIGNRKETWAGGDSTGTGMRAARQTVNDLNQLVERAVPPAVDILGVATAQAEVTVNDLRGERRGEYFRVSLPVNNATGAVWQPVITRAREVGLGGALATSQSGHIHLPPALERFEYDADGNVVRDGRWLYIWDAENRLVRMEASAEQPADARRAVEFQYDPAGRRTRKTVSHWIGSAWSAVLDEGYVYDGWNLVAVVNPRSGAVTKSFLWGADDAGRPRSAPGVGELLAVTVGGATMFPVGDGAGNVSALIDSAAGAAVATYESGPFGEPLRRSGAMAAANPYRFSTRYHDDETGLIYYGHRYYHPGLGRWLSRDPLGEPGGLNPYGFVANDPVQHFDLLGLMRVTRTGVCNSPGAKLGRFSWKGPVLYNCSKVNTATKTYSHETRVQITIGFDPGGGESGGGKLSFSVMTTHARGETVQIQLGCCSAAYWQYDFDCDCEPASMWEWELVKWDQNSSWEWYKGKVRCQLVSEGLHGADVRQFCPECVN